MIHSRCGALHARHTRQFVQAHNENLGRKLCEGAMIKTTIIFGIPAAVTRANIRVMRWDVTDITTVGKAAADTTQERDEVMT